MKVFKKDRFRWISLKFSEGEVSDLFSWDLQVIDMRGMQKYNKEEGIVNRFLYIMVSPGKWFADIPSQRYSSEGINFQLSASTWNTFWSFGIFFNISKLVEIWGGLGTKHWKKCGISWRDSGKASRSPTCSIQWCTAPALAWSIEDFCAMV